MKIMVAYDDTNVSREAASEALKQAGAFGAEVHLVTSISGGAEVPKKTFDHAESNLNRIKEKLFDPQNVPCSTHVLFRGLTAGEDLVRYAREKEIDELVMGVKRRSKVGKLFFGSTAQYVILRAHCPVLTVK
jgi:nucleotide-binding universal stress UspA family protein